MSRVVVRVVAVVAGVVALLVGASTAASAHPLGNFTVNRYSGVVVAADAVTVDHVLDIAEIPTAQRTPAIDTSGDGALSRPELAAWAATECADAARTLHLTVGGARTALSVVSATGRRLQGQAGLPTLRLECGLRAPASVGSPTSVGLVDTRADDEVGWREMTAVGDGTTLVSSDVPSRTRSARLTAYPQDLLTSPLDVRSLTLSVRPGGARLAAGAPAAADPAGSLVRGNDRLTLAFEGLLTRTEGHPLLGVVALLAALVLGASHAVAPGHGKTVMAFYLSGRREGALRSAATVGATVTVTHTAGVLLLGLMVSAGTAFVPARVYPWLSVVSGLLVVLVGFGLLRESARRRASSLPAGTHTHGLLGTPHSHPARGCRPPRALVAAGGAAPHVQHRGPRPRGRRRTTTSTDHEHLHDHGHQHDDAAPPSRRGLVAIGLAGGLLPSPSALLVLLGAVALGHPWFGVGLVVAFGLGMASTLAVVGLLVMRLRERAELRLVSHPASRLAPVLRLVPVLTAVGVVVLGSALAWRGLGSTGLR